MSISVALDALRDEIGRAGAVTYLLTVNDNGRPHAVAVAVEWDGDELAMRVGRRSAATAAPRPEVSLLWPPAQPGGYSLIVDGEAHGADGEGSTMLVRPTTAVLHRPAAPPGPSAAGAEGAEKGCGSDCVPVLRR
jgi:hypothetical protein